MKTALSLILRLTLVTGCLASALAQADTLNEHWQHLQQWPHEQLNRWGDEDRRTAIAQARVVPKGAQPELIIRRSSVDEYGDPLFANGLSFNGQTLKAGDTLKKARQLLGPESAQPGISVIAEWPHNRPFNPADQAEDAPVTAIHIRLNPEPGTQQPTFNGYLELDGAGIDAQTRIRDIRALASREGLQGAQNYIHCSSEHGYCYVGEVAGVIDFEVDERDKANGRLYGVSVYFGR